nr:hypothetical protein BaRGS_004826 [Batillaria attramentaria]
MSCAVLDQSSPNYGAMGYNVDRGYDGRPCGEGGVCYKYECHPANYTTALQPDPAEVAQWMQDGQWSSWSDYGSTCSSPCAHKI